MGPLDRVEDYLNEFRGVYLILGIFLFRSRFIGSQNAANEIPCSLYEILIEFMFVVSPSNQGTIEKQLGTEPLFFSTSSRTTWFYILATPRSGNQEFPHLPGKLVIGNLIANADVEIGGKSQSFLT